MSCRCAAFPVIRVTNIAIDTTTDIATLTLASAPPTSGCFTLCFNLCCTRISRCSKARVEFLYGSTTYANVLARNGNFLQLGQTSCQLAKCGVLHFNATTSPAENFISTDKLPCPAPAADICCASTSVTIDAAPAPVTPPAESPASDPFSMKLTTK